MPNLTKRFGGALSRLPGVPLATWGMIFAHIGLGVFVLGAVVEGHQKLSVMQGMALGDSVKLGQYVLRFQSLYQTPGANYDAQGGVFEVKDGKGRIICQPKPQRRFYPASNQVQSKVALCFMPLDDLYVVMAEPQAGEGGVMSWQVRFFYNPWVRLIFFGPLLMALGGALSLCDRRLRLGIARKANSKATKG